MERMHFQHSSQTYHPAPGQVAQPERTLTKALLRVGPRLGLTQAQLAQAVGVSAGQISKMAAGDKHLRAGSVQMALAAMIVRLFRALDAIVGGGRAPS